MPAIPLPLQSMMTSTVRWLPQQPPSPFADASLLKAARAFEAVFLAEMLSYAGLGQVPEGVGGGEGESAYASFLTHAYAEKLAESGRFGLTESILRSIAQTGGHDG